MASLDFPSSPQAGQLYSAQGKTWIWNGLAWAIQRITTPGDSAYDIAVQKGFVGDQAAWIASLKGAKGDKGDTGATGLQGPRGTTGDRGIDGQNGTNGTNGTNGQGVPTGGVVGQVLTKNSSNPYDASWITPDYVSDYTVPLGGNQGQFLGKTSAADGSFTWLDLPPGSAGAPEIPQGGNQGQVLTKASANPGDYTWANQLAANPLPSGGAPGQVLTKISTFEGDATWQNATGGVSDAPSDGTSYVRKNSAWVAESTSGGGTGANFPEAPIDGQKYARQNGAWTTFQEGVNGTNGTNGANGAQGPQGVKGDKGDTGPGVPAGGYTGQVLAKINGEDFNASWINAPTGGGSGTPAISTVDYPTWGQAVATVVQTFDAGVVPTNLVWRDNAPGSIITDPDVGPSTSKALQFGSGSQGNNADSWFEIPVVADATNYTVTVRYKTSGEPRYDGYRLNLDGGQVYIDLSDDNVWREHTLSLSAGTHTLRFRYTSDGSATSGFQNVHFSSITYPGLRSSINYNHGDTVRYNSKAWLCLVTGTNAEPGTNTDWALVSGILPVGGQPGQILTKVSINDGDAVWKFPAAAAGQTATHPYWRLYSIANNGDGYTGLREIQFFDSTGLVIPTNTGTAFAIGDDGYHTAASLFDGNTETIWQIQSNNNVFIGYHFPLPVGVTAISMMANRFTAQTPSNFRIEWSDDGVTYNTAWTVTSGSNGWNDYEVRTFIDPNSGTPKKPVPNGGTTGQILTKLSGTDQDVVWANDSTPYRIAGFFTSAPGTLETLLMHVVTDAFTYPVNLVGSQVKVGVNPSADVIFTLNKNSFAIGTVTVSSSGVVTMATTGGTTIPVAVGDLLTFVAPNDSLGMAATAFTFKGNP